MIKKVKCDEDTEVILEKGENNFDSLINDFENSEYINIVSFNLSATKNDLLEKLKEIETAEKIVVIVNIPKRYDSYFKKSYKIAANKVIETYLNKLNPATFKSPVEIYFNFENHSKIYTTSNLAYVGSKNFSDESSNNWEAGFITKNKDVIKKINEDLVEELKRNSIRYYGNQIEEIKDDFNINIANIETEIKNLINTIDYGDDPREFLEPIKLFCNNVVSELEEMKKKVENLELDTQLANVISKSLKNSLEIIEGFEDYLEEEEGELLNFDENKYVSDLLATEYSWASGEELDEISAELDYKAYEKLGNLKDKYIQKLDKIIFSLKTTEIIFLPITGEILGLTGNENKINNARV